MASIPYKAVSEKQVALFIEPSNGYDKGLLKGIQQYTKENQSWSVYIGDCEEGGDFTWLANWKGNGILARIESEQLADFIVKLNLPTVALCATGLEPDLPSLVTSEMLTAQTAAEYFLDRGIRSFATFREARHEAYVGLNDHFRACLTQRGYPCNAFISAYAGKSEIEKQIRIARWLDDLPKPIGILACSQEDVLVETCLLAGYDIPADVSIIGCDREELLYVKLDRQLSTVIVNSVKAGYNAAALLDQMMAKQASQHGNAEAVAMMDPISRKDKLVSEALDFIHHYACDGITVMDILNELPLSRRVLEHRFRKVLGRTPHEEIMAVRLKYVKQLLAETNLSLIAIADRAGFKHTEYLSVVFKREVGISPSRYRLLHNHRKPKPSPAFAADP
ncbi:MAG TPA: helix-turn-helix domain-containing protein [Paenibacillus sp.]|uniref:AraC family transcriptional regulator n=1 Tax=Paenibacillus sp. TaxID=58172 RepID=UPI002CDFE22B|nr:helix-turn-helix domain-containing protein [Paenibacillus sp.]HUC90457.1 helix-turn-helix domain-containing protein [Paenibacillus sp.]